MKLIDVLKANASKLNLLSINVENDEITKSQLLYQLKNVIVKELNAIIQGLEKEILKDLQAIETSKQESLIE